jgi:hypothetical protein
MKTDDIRTRIQSQMIQWTALHLWKRNGRDISIRRTGHVNEPSLHLFSSWKRTFCSSSQRENNQLNQRVNVDNPQTHAEKEMTPQWTNLIENGNIYKMASQVARGHICPFVAGQLSPSHAHVSSFDRLVFIVRQANDCRQVYSRLDCQRTMLRRVTRLFPRTWQANE